MCLTSEVIIFGAGGHSKVIIDALEESFESPEICLLDDDKRKEGTRVCGYEVFSSWEKVPFENFLTVVAIGSNNVRIAVAKKLHDRNFTFTSVIHPASIVAREVVIGCGTVVFPGAVINRGTSVGEHCIVNTNASLDHDCNIGSGVHIAPGATLCGSVMVGDGTLVGAGATILPNLKIGKNCIIGAGTTVRKNLGDGITAYSPETLHIEKRER